MWQEMKASSCISHFILSCPWHWAVFKNQCFYLQVNNDNCKMAILLLVRCTLFTRWALLRANTIDGMSADKAFTEQSRLPWQQGEESKTRKLEQSREVCPTRGAASAGLLCAWAVARRHTPHLPPPPFYFYGFLKGQLNRRALRDDTDSLSVTSSSAFPSARWRFILFNFFSSMPTASDPHHMSHTRKRQRH